jgi:hypothetical protein
MQNQLDPSSLSSSPLRQLYSVLSTFEANRDWSKAARAALLERVAARLPPTHQPDLFLQHQQQQKQQNQSPYVASPSTTLEDIEKVLNIGLDNPDSVLPNISRLSRAQSGQTTPMDISTGQGSFEMPIPTIGDIKAEVKADIGEGRKLSSQLASIMTTREMAAFAMLQMFTELSEQRIESWGRIARLIVLQPMDGFATSPGSSIPFQGSTRSK